VLPTITKILELRVLEFLNPILYGNKEHAGFIHPAQQGFRPKAGCEVQISRLLTLAEQCKAFEHTNRTLKVRPKFRERAHFAFVDFSKAYDKVDRDLLLCKMLKYNISPDIVN